MTDARFAPDRPLPRPSISIGTRRRDGKVLVTLSFPVSGRHLRKVWTVAQLHAHLAAHPGDGVYGIIPNE